MFSASFKSARVPATTMLFDSGSAETVTRRMGWLRASNLTIAFETTLTTLMAVALLSLNTFAPPAPSGAGCWCWTPATRTAPA